MATQTVNFNSNYSDPIEVTGNSMVIHIEFSIGGGVILERSITGDKFVTETVLNPAFRKLQVVEIGISGCVPGQLLRLRFMQSQPTSITILQ